jgi:hypothetical protein
VFWVGWGLGALLMLAAGRHQWFVRDDWALVITRQADRAATGGVHWLLFAQDGHWLTVPALLWDVTLRTFGLDSYWPFLLPAIAAYLGCVVLVRIVCLRAGVTAWTTTIVGVLLAMFGTGWENLVFAVQITYNLSLLAFLAQLLLADHDGPPDWRDGVGALVAVIGVASSGFGPFFLFGVALMLALRRRFLALLGVAPAGLAWCWWYLTYGVDDAAATQPGSKALVPEFAFEGLLATLKAMVGGPPLVGLAALGCIGVVVWQRHNLARQAPMLACTATAIVLFLGVGVQRVGMGIETAGASRYVGVGAVLLAPLVALAVDQLGRVGEPALIAGRIVLVASIFLNAGRLWAAGEDWARPSSADRALLELIAGSPRLVEADPGVTPIAPANPDVRVADIPRLVELGAITPRPPRTTEERAAVDAALGLAPAGTGG